MATLKEYDPGKVVVTWNGLTLSDGVATGTFITHAQTTANSTLSMNGDGGGTRVKSRDLSGSITLTLAQTSDVNQKLTELYESENLQSDPANVVSDLTVEDFSSDGSELVAEKAHIAAVANFERSTDGLTTQWIFESPCVRPRNNGGNSL